MSEPRGSEGRPGYQFMRAPKRGDRFRHHPLLFVRQATKVNRKKAVRIEGQCVDALLQRTIRLSCVDVVPGKMINHRRIERVELERLQALSKRLLRAPAGDEVMRIPM